MPRRRPYARVFRRIQRRGVGGAGDTYRPGWYIRVRQGGREVLRYAGLDRKTALAYAARIACESDRSDLLGEVPTPEVRFEAFAEDYLKHAKQAMTPRSYASRERLVRGLLVPFFSGMRLADLRAPDLQRFLASRGGVAAATRNRSLTAMSAIFRRALDLGLLEENPAAKVRRAKETRFPLTLVDEEQQSRLFALLDEPVRTFVMLLVDTGLRLGEAIDLQWADADFRAATLYVRASKAKRPRVVGMTRRIHEALGRLKESRTIALHGPDSIFPAARAPHFLLSYAWRIAFKRAAAQIGVPSLRIHDLRHLFAVNLVRRGIDLPTVQYVLGHKSLLSTLRYAEYADGSAPFRAARALDALHSQGDDPPARPDPKSEAGH